MQCAEQVMSYPQSRGPLPRGSPCIKLALTQRVRRRPLTWWLSTMIHLTWGALLLRLQGRQLRLGDAAGSKIHGLLSRALACRLLLSTGALVTTSGSFSGCPTLRCRMESQTLSGMQNTPLVTSFFA